MAQAKDTIWIPVLPSMRDFGPALAKGAGAEADKSGKAVGARFGKALAIGVAGVGVAVGTAGAALYKVGEVFDDVADTIRVGTGATGAALDGLVDSAKNVGKSVPADFEKVGTVVADINTRLGLSGATLETVASQYLEAGRILGEEVDVTKTSAAFSAFKIEGEGVIGAMDHLFQVSQATGVGMNELAEGAARNAPAMEILGFSFEETTAMIGSFDKAGLNSSALMASMSKGMVTLAKDGEEPAAAFKRVQGEIAGFIDAGNEAGALELASKVFGTKGAAQFVGAIKSGALNLEDMSKAAGQTGDSILGVGAETMDFAEQWQLFKNNVLVWLEPMGARVFGALGTIMGEVTDGVTAFGAAFSDAGTDVTSSGIAGFLETMGLALGGIVAIFKDGDFNGKLRGAFGWEEDHPMVDFLFNVRDLFFEVSDGIKAFGSGWSNSAEPITQSGLPGFMESLGGFLRAAFDYVRETVIPALQDFATWVKDNGDKIMGWVEIIGIVLIPAFARMAFAALLHGASVVLAWVLMQLAAIKTAIVYVAQSIIIVAQFAWMATMALIHGARMAISWIVGIIAPAAVAVATMIVTAAGIVGKWAWMGLQSLFHAGRMAAAWLIAMGPVGWVIGIVAGLVAVVIANWDKITAATEKLPEMFERVMVGIGLAWDKLKEISKKPVRFVVETVIGGLVDTFNKIPGVDIAKPKLPAGFKNGGYTGDGPADEIAGPAHRGEFYFTKKQTAAIGKKKLYEMAHSATHGGAATAGGGNMGGFFTGNAAQIRKHGAMYLDVAGGMGPWNFPGAAGLWDGAAGVKVKVGRGSHQAQVRPLERGGGILGFSSNTNIDMSPSWMATLGAAQRRTVAAHEIGHSLGLPHNSGNSIMQPNLANMASVPTAQDIANLQHLYPGGSGKAGAGVQENPFSGLVTKLMDQFKKQFPEGGMIIDSVGGLVKSAIEKVTKWIQDIKDGVKNVAGDVVDSIRGFFGGGAATADVPFLHDQGGVVHPGMSTILNKTRKPEALLNPQQWSDIHKLALQGAPAPSPAFEFPDRMVLEIGGEQVLARLVDKGVRTATRGSKGIF